MAIELQVRKQRAKALSIRVVALTNFNLRLELTRSTNLRHLAEVLIIVDLIDENVPADKFSNLKKRAARKSISDSSRDERTDLQQLAI